MAKRLTLSCVVLALVIANVRVTHAQEPPPVLSGDELEARVTALEATVADLQDQISVLQGN
jgi:uncharacterized protein YceH (UPF0502 family)